MRVIAGTRLGSYEVGAQIGAGGMGEVYEARDTKLGRNVAIKVLPAAFAHDAERIARFQREAKMLAALNHPNIATIYGLEHSDGTHFLVMELVPGETLADRVKADPVPVEEALKIAVQIAEALEAAHEKNIIHRDLKPANVKVTPEGIVKVLDFGLAKAFEGESGGSDLANSPTLTQAATMQGVILGTAAYMSPEQARGKSVDKRTDIWAFGCVLYEILTGKRVFEGEHTTDILAAVVRAEPDWNQLLPSTPRKIRDLLQRCLQKDRAQRMQSAGDARIEIQEALSSPVAPESAGVVWSRFRGWRLSAVLGLAALVGAAVVAIAALYLRPAPTPKLVSRMVIDLPPGDHLAALDYPAIGISPDGTELAYVAIHAGTRQIFLRALDSLEAKPLAGTEGANTPFFSPDGQWLGFFAGGRLKKISVSGGGGAQTLGTAGNPLGATWTGKGTIIFAGTTASLLQLIPEAGGPPQAVTRLEKGEISHGLPEMLPAGKAVLFAAGAGGVDTRIVAQSLSSGERHDLVPGGTAPRYAASGHLIYWQGGNLMAAPFDGRQLQITGPPVTVTQGVQRAGNFGGVQYALSGTGSLAYVPGAAQEAERLVWVSRNGTEQSFGPPHAYMWPQLSPDGRHVGVTIGELERQVMVYDFARETLSRFTFEGSTSQLAVWTPDGKRIVLASNREGPTLNLFWQSADRSGALERLTTSEYALAPKSFSPDGKLLAYVEINPNTGYDIWVLRLSDLKAQPWLQTPFNESVPQFSPDGHWLAYISDESGIYEVYAQPYPGPGGKYQISTEGGTEPVWNPNGKELFYRNSDKMMAVDVATQPGFSVGKPRILFQGQYVPTSATFPYYDVSRDGQRFLMIKESEDKPALTQIVVVQNWFEELKARVPPGK